MQQVRRRLAAAGSGRLRMTMAAEERGVAPIRRWQGDFLRDFRGCSRAKAAGGPCAAAAAASAASPAAAAALTAGPGRSAPRAGRQLMCVEIAL